MKYVSGCWFKGVKIPSVSSTLVILSCIQCHVVKQWFIRYHRVLNKCSLAVFLHLFSLFLYHIVASLLSRIKRDNAMKNNSLQKQNVIRNKPLNGFSYSPSGWLADIWKLSSHPSELLPRSTDFKPVISKYSH